jgi:small subunit ribosomal protein S16
MKGCDDDCTGRTSIRDGRAGNVFETGKLFCEERAVAVRLRLKRMGRRHRPFYRVAAIDSRTRRDGRVIELLGHYDPIAGKDGKQIELKLERVDYWLGVGAQPSDTVKRLIEKARAAQPTG